MLAGTMLLGLSPAAALGTPGGRPSKAKAYGRFCQGESKKHVAGQRGTPYSVCVSGAKKLLKQQAGG